MEKRKLRLFQVDAFTDSLYKGNPAGVCLIPPSIDLTDEEMQSIATEMNLSETAFVKPVESCIINLNTRFSLRWFTPTEEVDLCGHGTLATSHTLFNSIMVEAEQVNFDTRSGELTAVNMGDNGIRLDFPIAHLKQPPVRPSQIIQSLYVSEMDILDIQYAYDRGTILIKIRGERLEQIKPDFRRMMDFQADYTVENVIITCESNDKRYDFLSRVFCPWNGIDEDPVTGSAHTVLAPYWASVMGKSSFRAYQASKRGGELLVSIHGERVFLVGKAVSFFETVITI
jgi:PhzF family phenazine biosynthesis protein